MKTSNLNTRKTYINNLVKELTLAINNESQTPMYNRLWIEGNHKTVADRAYEVSGTYTTDALTNLTTLVETLKADIELINGRTIELIRWAREAMKVFTSFIKYIGWAKEEVVEEVIEETYEVAMEVDCIVLTDHNADYVVTTTDNELLMAKGYELEDLSEFPYEVMNAIDIDSLEYNDLRLMKLDEDDYKYLLDEDMDDLIKRQVDLQSYLLEVA